MGRSSIFEANALQRSISGKGWIFCLLFILCYFCSGCMQFSLTASGNKDEESKNGAVYYGSYYGFSFILYNLRLISASVIESNSRAVKTKSSRLLIIPVSTPIARAVSKISPVIIIT